MHLVSIIVPVFNSEPFLRECLDSLCAQSYSNLEIILIDDGSSDGSPSILRNYADKDPRILLLSQNNAGQSAARNRGLDIAKGDFIMFVDSDDIVDIHIVERLMNAALDSKTDIAACSFSTKKHFRLSDNRPVTLPSEEALALALYQTRRPLNPSPCAKIFRRKIWENLRFPEGMIYEDLAIMPRLFLAASSIAVINDCLYFYRQHPESTLNTFSTKRLDALKATDQICSFLADKSLPLRKAADDRRLSACFNIFFLLANNNLAKTYFTSLCFSEICRLRRQSILNHHVRPKNRLASFISYFGRKPLLLLKLLARTSP